MTYSLRPGRHEGVEILSIVGPFTLNNIFQLQRDLKEMRPPCLIFDITQVPFMDSAALGLVVDYHASAQKTGRRVAVAGAGPRIITILQMTKLDSVLRLYATVEEAEAAG